MPGLAKATMRLHVCFSASAQEAEIHCGTKARRGSCHTRFAVGQAFSGIGSGEMAA
jgi:hypothetical protein